MAARSSGKRRDGWSCRGLLSGMMLYGCGGGGWGWGWGWLRWRVAIAVVVKDGQCFGFLVFEFDFLSQR